MCCSRVCALALICLTAACAPQPIETTSSEAAQAAIRPTSAEPAEALIAPDGSQPTPDSYLEARQRMVAAGIVAYGIEDPETLRAMRTVPRHLFVPAQYQDQAYDNIPLPIGHGQTISQPYIVALMTQELQLEPGDRVLEIGTGSGYQAAVLAELGVQVYSIEIVEQLAALAAQRLDEIGYKDLNLKQADGYFGWEGAAPFDAIIVTAAPDHVPHPLLDQLKIGGILVIPVGPVGGFQELWRVVRTEQESYESSSLGGVRFVPLVRESDQS